LCADCGCLRPFDNHGDPRHLTLPDLRAAAKASGTNEHGAVANMVRTLSLIGKARKSRASAYATCQVVKAATAKQFTLGVAYPAWTPDVSVAADGHRDFVSAEALEKTAWEWMAKFRDVSLFHAEGTSGHFTPTESYILRCPDWTVTSPVDGREYVVKTGAWMLGGTWDDYGWDCVQQDLVRGWSPEGGARRSTPTPARLAQLRI